MKKLLSFLFAALLLTAPLVFTACDDLDLPDAGDAFLDEDGVIVPPVEGAATEELMTEEEKSAFLEDSLKQAFVDKYDDWDIDNIVLELQVSTEGYASGGVGFADTFGGGYFYAAETAEGWVIAWDGQDLVACEDIELYDFPVEIIPYCYDYENGVDVER